MPFKPRGPLSLSGLSLGSEPGSSTAFLLRVAINEAAEHPACVSPDEPALCDWDWDDSLPHLQLASGGDCAVQTVRSASVPVGTLLLTPESAHNLRVCVGEALFSTFETRERLVEASLEVRALGGVAARSELDARALLTAVRSRCVGAVLTCGQVLLLELAGVSLRVRVGETHTVDASSRQEKVGYHCFRGLCTAETHIYFESDASIVLANNAPRPVTVKGANIVTVQCDDEECFPVHKRLLRPCIALTRAIRRAGPDCGSEVEVPLSSSVFDKVLLFLEAHDAGSPVPAFSLSHLQELSEAARALGLRSLDDWCCSQREGFSARLREYSFEEIRAANAAGGSLLLIDGMVLDVKAWLPEHPGGSSILKSLDMDASRYFELYHHSRESFLYLRHFYVGELAA
jgi:Cytochrome b5-like Heme/Steroid binding domain